VDQRLCRKCNVVKTADDFTKSGRHCKDCTRERYRAWREKNKEYAISVSREYYEANKETIRERARQQYAEQPEKHQAYRQRMSKERAAQIAVWKKANAGRVREQNSRRYAERKRAAALISKQYKDEMAAIYEEAARISRETGVPHHVDHIAPLRGKTVSGLHVPWNMRVVPAHENLSKGARVNAALIQPAIMGEN
jgi:hypothetical protein